MRRSLAMNISNGGSMQGKSYLMAGVAVVALVASSDAGLAKTKHHAAAPAPAASTDSTAAPAASNGPTNQELADRLSALEAELAADHEKRDSDHNRLSALEQNFNDTSWTFDNSRPTVRSGDGRFTLSIPRALPVQLRRVHAGLSNQPDELCAV